MMLILSDDTPWSAKNCRTSSRMRDCFMCKIKREFGTPATILAHVSRVFRLTFTKLFKLPKVMKPFLMHGGGSTSGMRTSGSGGN